MRLVRDPLEHQEKTALDEIQEDILKDAKEKHPEENFIDTSVMRQTLKGQLFKVMRIEDASNNR